MGMIDMEYKSEEDFDSAFKKAAGGMSGKITLFPKGDNAMEDNILDEQLGELMAPNGSDEITTEPPAAPEKATRPRVGKKDQPKVKADVKITERQVPADDRIRIIIDREKGMSNFETVGVNGKVYQIERGVAVYVPPEVVHVLGWR